MHHSFDISIAKKYGVNVAIFLNNVAYWIIKNQANEKHFHDGRYWTYNSVKSYSVLFPYWTPRQVGTVIDHCLSHNLLIKDNFNGAKYDQTQWYALTDLSHKLLNIPISPKCEMKLDVISHKCEMDLTDMSNGFNKYVKPIPNIKTNINTDRERAPLSENFKPDQERSKAVLQKAAEVGLTAEQILIKFKNVAKTKQKVSSDWQAELDNFLINERPSYSAQQKYNYPVNEARSTVQEWGPGHPSWEIMHGNKKTQVVSNNAIYCKPGTNYTT